MLALLIPGTGTALFSEVPPLPVVEDAQVAILRPDIDGGPVFSYTAFSHREPLPSLEYYRVHFELIPTNSGRPLRAASNRIYFQPEEQVSPNSQEYRDEHGANWLTLVLFDQKFVGDWEYLDVGAQAPANTLYKQMRNRTEFFIGYRFAVDDGHHYGWMKFTRPDTDFTTAFDLTEYAWNPLPGKPIGAGLPPMIPLTPAVTSEELRLTWPVQVWSWVLESTESLGPEAVWEPVPNAVGPEVILPLPEAYRFFRLRDL